MNVFGQSITFSDGDINTINFIINTQREIFQACEESNLSLIQTEDTQTYPKLFEAVSVKLQEIFNIKLQKIQNGTFTARYKGVSPLNLKREILQACEDCGFELIQITAGDTKLEYLYLSDTDPKLIEAIAVKLKELYNLSLQRTEDRGYVASFSGSKSFYLTVQAQIIEAAKETGFELTTFGTSQKENVYVFQKK
ncbi:hypothetical protein M0811_11828 [Anaeramoeba ignava]|uniref:Uncharacterized protein n=1 Tax=Anaeramoeba ignava TaxID=1746090 RepID=A0A9Q0LC46_ANAIG|nr:hypothetical protein M0811_11828 [Anaeramoeba ignava]